MGVKLKNVAIIQARMGSSELRGKSLRMLSEMPVLQWVVNAAHAIRGVDEVIVATSTDASDDAIAAFGDKTGTRIFRGDVKDVLTCFYHAATEACADRVLRLMADSPFLDPEICSTVLALLARTNADYASNTLVATWPGGVGCEAMRFSALKAAFENARLPADREHVTQYLHHHRADFNVVNYACPLPGLAGERWTLDHEEDFRFLEGVARELKSKPARYTEVLDILDRHPQLRELNRRNPPEAGLTKSNKQDQAQNHSRSFERSLAMLERAERVTPLGSQTFSKSRTQYPAGHTPLYVTHGLGGRIWDVDGNEYVDMVNGLLPNVLGYADPDVDYAIRNQLDSGITLSLATELEIKVAEKLVDIIPCAESVRFGKNGSDATSACIRLARAFTRRDRVIACGYHGWQDWYIGTTSMYLGVPQCVQEMTHRVPYNDLAAVERILQEHPGEFAALIMEPMNFFEPNPGYLLDLHSLLKKHGALLIFDEVITGFRFALGGAQEYFGVTPDLASFGKSMGNGMPISAAVGRKDILSLLDRVFISSTFGGETLSLAASLAVIDKMERQKVIASLWETGERISCDVTRIIERFGLTKFLQFKGKAPWQLLDVQGDAVQPAEFIKTFLVTKLAENGVLFSASHNICFAHGEREIASVLTAYENVLGELAAAIKKGSLQDQLVAPVIKPILRVR